MYVAEDAEETNDSVIGSESDKNSWRENIEEHCVNQTRSSSFRNFNVLHRLPNKLISIYIIIERT